MERIRQLNPVLPGMIFWQVLLGLLGEAAIIIFFSDKVSVAVGFAAGIIYTITASIHMAVVIDRAVYYEDKGAVARTIGGYLVRLLIFIVMEVILYITAGDTGMLASVGAMFVMKVSAWLQPFTDKVAMKFRRRG